MAELSFALKTIEPLKGALDIIRYLDALDDPVAGIDDLTGKLDLSERAFSKAIRRLVTKGYVQMDGDQIYRLTDMGMEAGEKIANYDEDRGADAPATAAPTSRPTTRSVSRRLVVTLPRALPAGQPAEVQVGFHPTANGGALAEPVDMVVRLTIVNGEPDTPQDESINLTDSSSNHVFQVTAGFYTKSRIRVQVFQLGPGPDDIAPVGGMHVDVDVITGDPGSDLMAYGTDITLTVEE